MCYLCNRVSFHTIVVILVKSSSEDLSRIISLVPRNGMVLASDFFNCGTSPHATRDVQKMIYLGLAPVPSGSRPTPIISRDIVQLLLQCGNLVSWYATRRWLWWTNWGMRTRSLGLISLQVCSILPPSTLAGSLAHFKQGLRDGGGLRLLFFPKSVQRQAIHSRI